MAFKHIPVLFNETIDSLQIKPDGVYVDCTSGGGGHSAAILARLENGRLICLDQDPQAIETLQKRFGEDKRVTVVKTNFSDIKTVLQSFGMDAVDGVLADLGVSSHQLDTAERGFSFHSDAPLDMRMSMQGMSAADVVNTYSEPELANVIFRYGEEKYSRSIARAIVKAREKKRIETTFELTDIIKSAMPAKAMRDGHPSRKTFQAIRIEVNGELSRLPDAIGNMFDCLKIGGVLSIISFHSLEDGVVKTKFKEFTQGCICPKEFPVCICGNTPRGALAFRGKTPSAAELEENPRSRSAKLRSIVKLK
ncbi:MAG: 16S rRNA (cytosine(1402)-N(4))-methyltransferase RsmH [Ruminococcaceae bacterium]|nr:16S rRNA (cytosine(1402)-N(4))-methyltransferase RsmH [Oscillospiraceae bacterium]